MRDRICELFRTVETVTGYGEELLKSRCRAKGLVYARMIFAYEAAEMGVRIVRIAKLLERKHPTILHEIQQYHDDYKHSWAFREQADSVSALFGRVSKSRRRILKPIEGLEISR